MGQVDMCRAGTHTHRVRSAFEVNLNDGHRAGKDWVCGLTKRLMAIPDEAFGVSGYHGGALRLLTRSPKREGYWQLTRFTETGVVWGDSQFACKRVAIRAFLRDIDPETLEVAWSAQDIGEDMGPAPGM
jgi:hypothetical protein